MAEQELKTTMTPLDESTKVEAPKVEAPKVESAKKIESAKVESAKVEKTEKADSTKKADPHTAMVEELSELPFTPSDTIQVVVKIYNGAMGAKEYDVPMTTQFVKNLKKPK